MLTLELGRLTEVLILCELHLQLMLLRLRSERRVRQLELDVHKVEISDLLKRFNTNIENGLTSEQAKLGNEEHGLNQLTPPPTPPEWVKFCHFAICRVGITVV